MIVKELIELLQKCNPNDIVMYELPSVLEDGEMHYGIDDVLVGNGSLTGIVYLKEDDDE